MFFRSGFNYDRDAASKEAGLVCPEGDDRAQQQFKEECDINTIVKRFGLTGELPENPRVPQYGDFTGITDFRSALDVVQKAQEAFYEFPAEVRKRFNNDPQELLLFVSDEKNREEGIKLGLFKKPPEKTRDVVQAVDELAARLAPPPQKA